MVDLGVVAGEDGGAARAEDAAPREAISRGHFRNLVGVLGAYRGWFVFALGGSWIGEGGRYVSSFEVVVIGCRE